MGNINFNRDPHNRDYTCISNEILRNAELSWKAKGLFCYILSLPDNWRLYKSELQNHGKDGRTAIDSGFDELENAGFIKSIQKNPGELEFCITERPAIHLSFNDVEIQHTLCTNSTEDNVQNQQLLNTEINTELLTTKAVSSSLNISEENLKKHLLEKYRMSFSEDFYARVAAVCGEQNADPESYLDWFLKSKENSCSNLQNYTYKTAVLSGVVAEYKKHESDSVAKSNAILKTKICKACGHKLTNVDLSMGECVCGKDILGPSDYEEVSGGQNE